MSNHEGWNEFLGNMINCTTSTYKKSTEYEYIRKKQEDIYMLFHDNLDIDERGFVEECIFELGLMANRESEILYRQGMRDCIFILKELGVLA